MESEELVWASAINAGERASTDAIPKTPVDLLILNFMPETILRAKKSRSRWFAIY